MTYNEDGINALDRVQKVIEGFGLSSTAYRKFSGVLDAIEIQIEDYEYSPETLHSLLKALVALADFYHLPDELGSLKAAIAQFQKELGI